jgi:ribosomal protein S18 acetylase RimI-like enzyme
MSKRRDSGKEQSQQEFVPENIKASPSTTPRLNNSDYPGTKMQSSISSWLMKPEAAKQNEQPLQSPPMAPPIAKRPPPPPKSTSAPPRVLSSTSTVPKAMDNWNDIPDDFLQAPSRPRPKKGPRSSNTVTPLATSRVPTPVTLPSPKPAIPHLFALRPLPSNVEIASLTNEHLLDYKRLNALTLPIAYPESFYKETMTEPNLSITLVALWHSSPAQTSTKNVETESARLVGAIRCRLLPSSQLYISTIGILAPYRSHGIAMHLLQAVVKKAVELHGVRCVTAHVWEANDEGVDWYKKRNFEILEKEEAYYRKLKPHGAYLVRKWIGVGDLLGGNVA